MMHEVEVMKDPVSPSRPEPEAGSADPSPPIRDGSGPEPNAEVVNDLVEDSPMMDPEEEGASPKRKLDETETSSSNEAKNVKVVELNKEQDENSGPKSPKQLKEAKGIVAPDADTTTSEVVSVNVEEGKGDDKEEPTDAVVKNKRAEPDSPMLTRGPDESEPPRSSSGNVRGCPKKSLEVGEAGDAPLESGPKSRGRPRQLNEDGAVKQGRGRPKTPMGKAEPNAKGRPRKEDATETEKGAPKRKSSPTKPNPRGRPKKAKTEDVEEQVSLKDGKQRSKKTEQHTPKKNGKGRGRPKKVKTDEVEEKVLPKKTSGGRGRSKKIKEVAEADDTGAAKPEPGSFSEGKTETKKHDMQLKSPKKTEEAVKSEKPSSKKKPDGRGRPKKNKDVAVAEDTDSNSKPLQFVRH